MRSPTPRPLRVVVAPDEFGGTLAADAAAAAIEAGWRRVRPDDVIDRLPQSDGGPGFLAVLSAAGVGDGVVAVPVTGPLGRPTDAHLLVDDETVYLESAQACGLPLLGSRGPTVASAWSADTRGVGMLLRAAVETGAKRIVVGLGGSATTDGGRGACEALGGVAAARDLLKQVSLIAATDVTNPLLGARGAATVFGPQKGADPETVAKLEQRLAEWAEVLEGDGGAVRAQAGAGAAGGLGAFLLAMGARRRSGAAVVAEVTGRAERIAAADLVVTGEGKFDAQTAAGKVVAAVASDARSASVPVVVVAGQVLPDADVDGVVAAYSMVVRAGSLEAAVGRPAAVLADVAEQVADDVSRGLGGALAKSEGEMRE
ncbi:glycerate kinase [Gordonia sp. (in: high G+C Gram-positive bacteria)]|uniref:glycerate kinase family protein n=1 Tax=Gordonia sp. (in: high G+C Gram-positive bacteria) TaxID=84139 RepID=UPI0016A34C8E|nr:glycerate kinase [Gordonia sp. (in: high G+C Gram-positive bacteria)]NLG46889.1 glycerate kinase [Gordonia sp. (in: high G+C Gram-positive bacteria)]